MRTVLRNLVLAAVVAAVGLAAANVFAASIGLNFTGANQRVANVFVPDTMGAVGPDHIVEMLNGVYTVYDKATGQQLQRMSLDAFWSQAMRRGAGGSSNDTFDPRVVYDPTSDHWFAVSAGRTDTRSDIYLAVAADPTFPLADLTRGWKGYVLDGDPRSVNDTRFADFPALGVNADSITLNWHLVPRVGTGLSVGLQVVSVPKADLLAATPTLANRSSINLDSAVDIIGVAKALLPVLNFGPSRNQAPLFAVHPQAGLWQWDVSDTAIQAPGAAQIHGPTEVPIDDFVIAPPGRQPDGAPSIFNAGGPYVNQYVGLLEHGNIFRSNLVQQGDSVWGVHVADANGRSGVRWYEIDATSNRVLQSGTITDPALDLIYPSIAVNSIGDAVTSALRPRVSTSTPVRTPQLAIR